MKALWITPLVLFFLIFISACSGLVPSSQVIQTVQPSKGLPSPFPPTPIKTAPVETQPPLAGRPPQTTPPGLPAPGQGTQVSQSVAREAVDAAKNLLFTQLNIHPEDIDIVTVESITWPDSCLGLNTGKMCLEVLTPGYRITLAVESKLYEVHTDLNGKNAVLVPDNPFSQLPAISWQSPEQPCQTLEIKAAEVFFGDCSSNLTPGKFINHERLSQLVKFAGQYQSFTAETRAGRITFQGQGQVTASPPERRAVAEWARLVFMEEQAGRGGAAWGLVFSWSRQGGIAGFCDDLAVYIDGEVVASSCKNDQLANNGRFFLNKDQLEQLYSWVDQFQAFENIQSDQATVDSMTVRLNFYGSGIINPEQSDRQQILSFASELFYEAGK